MTEPSLADALRDVDSPLELVRDLGLEQFTAVPDEYTNWIEEQRAWRESCALADQSYHMSTMRVAGPDAVQLFSDFAVNGLVVSQSSLEFSSN